MTIARLTITPSAAAGAYQRANSMSGAGAPEAPSQASFGSVLGSALNDAVELGHDADSRATDAIISGGDVTHVVTAISKAQLALQEIVSVRDKVVSAYQDVMRMSI